jgi:hypothetical protein
MASKRKPLLVSGFGLPCVLSSADERTRTSTGFAQQILSLQRLPFRHVGRNSHWCRLATRPRANQPAILPILYWPPSVSEHSESALAAPGLWGVTSPHRRRCGETELDARPPHLAPGRTLTQPTASLRPLVGSYPTVSPLTRTRSPRRPSRWRVCFLLRLWSSVGYPADAPTCCFVGQPCSFHRTSRESGSSSDRLWADQRRLAGCRSCLGGLH